MREGNQIFKKIYIQWKTIRELNKFGTNSFKFPSENHVSYNSAPSGHSQLTNYKKKFKIPYYKQNQKEIYHVNILLYYTQTYK